MSIKAIISIVLNALLFFSFTSFADSVSHAEHNNYFKCKHTQQKIERTKNCPCGCNKKKVNITRIVSGEHDCDSDDVVAHTPAFEKLTTTNISVRLPQVDLLSAPAKTQPVILTNHTISPPVPPG